MFLAAGAASEHSLIHPAARGLWQEMKDCGFLHSEWGLAHCGRDYWIRWVKLLDGTPFFGDDLPHYIPYNRNRR